MSESKRYRLETPKADEYASNSCELPRNVAIGERRRERKDELLASQQGMFSDQESGGEQRDLRVPTRQNWNDTEKISDPPAQGRMHSAENLYLLLGLPPDAIDLNLEIGVKPELENYCWQNVLWW